MSLLTVDAVSGGYNRADVLRDVTMHIDADEVVAFLGANGAGKTSLLRALAGTLPRSRGKIVLDDRNISRLPPWTRVQAGLAMVPEGRHVFGPLTVEENLEVGSLNKRSSVVTLDAVFDLFPRLAERRQQVAGSLSGGEQQMLALGRALLTGPRILAIDEMSAGLAPVIVEILVDGLARLRGSGIGVLLVEQSPHFIADLVDRIYLIERGAVVREGTLEDLGGADALAELYLGVS